MSNILVLSLMAGVVYAVPFVLLYHYRHTIPPGPMWVAALCCLLMPGVAWFVALFVALKDWNYPPARSEE